MFITALDIGTNKIKALVAESKNNKLFLHKIFRAPSSGIRKGEIVDIDETKISLKEIFEKIKEFDKSAVKNIFVNIGGANIKSHNSKGIIAVSRGDNEITQDDIDRVNKASQAIKLHSNREIIHTITKEFIIDGIEDIRDPLGMNGARLEVNNIIIDAFSPNIKNIISLIEMLGGNIGGLAYNPLVASRAVLTKIQKDLGAVLIDIGAGATSIGVYEEGKLLHAASFPVGAGHITNDLAIGLKCSVKLAELIKIFFGCATLKGISPKEKITLDDIVEKSGIDFSDVEKNFKAVISKREVVDIIESRLTEIFEFVNNELKLINKAGRLPGGAILCGGGAKLPLILDLAKEELGLPVEIGLLVRQLADKNIEIIDSDADGDVFNPEFAVAFGLLLLGEEHYSNVNKWSISDKFSIKSILRYFMP